MLTVISGEQTFKCEQTDKKTSACLCSAPGLSAPEWARSKGVLNVMDVECTARAAAVTLHISRLEIMSALDTGTPEMGKGQRVTTKKLSRRLKENCWSRMDENCEGQA
ncbi:hypothetical protein EVAR_91358_1 [Eumeta japonica]|uniref:Uncharacterized protein n=1 Tax=Eumeta variegata TaxID=151549 RepID=A0A4C1SFP5_EUMVA|nr:hypothetical protein EVAR_91358_1 [Eumeta japonica]